MGGRSPILVGLVLVMVLGCAIYFRLWTIDYTISSDETEILRFVSIFSLFFNSRAILFFSKRKSPFWSVWLMRKSFRRIKENREVHSSYAIWFSWAESIFRNPGQIKCRFDSLFFFFFWRDGTLLIKYWSWFSIFYFILFYNKWDLWEKKWLCFSSFWFRFLEMGDLLIQVFNAVSYSFWFFEESYESL